MNVVVLIIVTWVFGDPYVISATQPDVATCYERADKAVEKVLQEVPELNRIYYECVEIELEIIE